MSKDILFDNIIITDDILVSEQWAMETFDKKRQKIAKDSVSFILLICFIIFNINFYYNSFHKLNQEVINTKQKLDNGK